MGSRSAQKVAHKLCLHLRGETSAGMMTMQGDFLNKLIRRWREVVWVVKGRQHSKEWWKFPHNVFHLSSLELLTSRWQNLPP